ncbi:hypothetical protein HNP37_002660 [Flavobacterium nitrogenifigens]|uniref:Uncharacterized protein n=2 Tax=Flavobacterium TaxID=237 RepID=A0A7W7IY39_9FLAO|nr:MULTISPECIES: hypothetical protein [Flavobacterium]MBB4802585.1 hypothetical protein [Flavobacterium nitrogenifigens]MBB6387543.1 hypothetical protein [Flavobacterium notoginsengisoli]
MKKIIYVLILSLIVASGFVFANREIKNEISKKPAVKNLSNAEKKKWEATPDGIMFKKWEASPAGYRVYASEAIIRKPINENANMMGVVTSLSLPSGARLGFGIMVKIDHHDYILSFGLERSGSNEFQQLKSLKVNDTIIIKSQSVSHAPKYLYPIISGDYVERDNKVIYKRVPRKGGC